MNERMRSSKVGISEDSAVIYKILCGKIEIGTVNNYRQVTGMVTGENFAFFIYRHFVEIL